MVVAPFFLYVSLVNGVEIRGGGGGGEGGAGGGGGYLIGDQLTPRRGHRSRWGGGLGEGGWRWFLFPRTVKASHE